VPARPPRRGRLVSRIPGPPDWGDGAACRGMDVRLFYPVKADSGPVAAVRSTCARCPVIDTCARYAIHHEMLGWWGGMSPEERRIYRRSARIPLDTPHVPKMAQHGTIARYRQHYRDGESPCEMCMQAKRAERGRRRYDARSVAS